MVTTINLTFLIIIHRDAKSTFDVRKIFLKNFFLLFIDCCSRRFFCLVRQILLVRGTLAEER